MDYRILGPLVVSREGEPVTLAGRRSKELLSLLLLHPNELVSSDRLIEDLWAGAAPDRPRKAVHVYVSRLRKTLGDDVLETRAPGYVLHVAMGEFDVWRFEGLAAQGRRALATGDPARAATALRRALALWRGPALADVMYEPFAQAEAARLDEVRLCCVEARVDADLALGRHEQLVGELEALTDQHRGRERLRGQLMVALYRSGRQAEALAVYRQARRDLLVELGLEPGPDLRSLEAAILQQDPRLTWTPQQAPGVRVRGEDRVFVGRERQLAQLMAGVHELRRGRGALFLVRGEPGIGKTRLAEEVAARAAERGVLALFGRCWESGGAPAYWPWVQGLRQLVEETEPDALAAQLSAGAVDVARIVPEIRELIPGLPHEPALDPDGGRFRLFDAVSTLLRNASRSRLIVLVLDDLHAADAPSLRLLRFLTDALVDARVLVIVTAREGDAEANEGFAAAVADVARSDRFHDLALEGLERDDVARLAADVGARGLPPQLVDAIFERTEGHPFFVAELIRLLASGGRLDAIPHGVRAVVRHRIAALPAECGRLLSVASVIGREFSNDVLARAAGISAERTVEELDAALQAKALVTAPGAPGRFRFAHALVGEVLYDELPTSGRVRLHRAAAEALEVLRAPELDRHVAELAHHFFAAAPSGCAAKAVQYATRAAERAVAELAYEEAARLYEMAVTAQEMQPAKDALACCELLLGLGGAQASANDMVSAKATFARAAELARRDKMGEHLARAALGYAGRLVVLPADDPLIVPLLEDALDALGGDGGVLRARLLARLACAALRPSLSLDAIELARNLDDPATLAWALHARVVLAWSPANLDELIALGDEMIKAAERAGDLEQALNGHLNRLELLIILGRTPAARLELAGATRLAHELRLPSARWHVAVHETGLALLAGRFAEADALIQQAQHLGKRSSSEEVTINAVIQRFPVLLEQRRVEELRPALEEIAAAYPHNGVYQCLLARLEYEAGDHSSARSILEILADDDWASVRHTIESLLGMALLAETAALLADRDRAAELYGLLAPYESLVAAAPHWFPMGAMSRYLGMLAAVLSHLDDAARLLEDAAARNAAIGARPWVAHAHADHARALLVRQAPGDREHAGDLLREALAIHEELGMPASAERVAALHAQTGGPPLRDPTSSPPRGTPKRRTGAHP